MPESIVLEGEQSDSSREMALMIAHDLRSPLTGISACFELLQTGFFGELNERGMSTVSRLQNVTARLLSMVDDLLSLEQMNAGKLILQNKKTDFGFLCTSAIDSIATLADNAQIKIDVKNGGTEIVCDAGLIIRVCTNLIANAIKYSPPKETIELSLWAIGDYVEINIKDRGPGIPDSLSENIFDPFVQGSCHDRSVYGGSGLGLHICKAIVEAHGGSIGVSQRPGGGSVFWFRLPNKGLPPLGSSSCCADTQLRKNYLH